MVAFLAGAATLGSWAGGLKAFDAMDTAELRFLDKVTARVSTVTVPVGTSVRFGRLEVTVHSCQKQPPEEPPEAAAFLEVAELPPGKPREPLFHGWMFASSPALSAVDHPVYDLWVLDCRSTASTADESASEEAAE